MNVSIEKGILLHCREGIRPQMTQMGAEEGQERFAHRLHRLTQIETWLEFCQSCKGFKFNKSRIHLGLVGIIVVNLRASD